VEQREDGRKGGRDREQEGENQELDSDHDGYKD
jgi:hypothetical protein